MPAASFQFNFGSGDATPREPDAPMRLLLLGDFSGQTAAERTPLAQRPPLRVDIDSLDRVLAKLAPRVQTPAGPVAFATLDDFHPDALYDRLELFGALREARARPAPQGEDSPLAALLGGKPASATTGSSTPKSGLEGLIERVVAPHIVPDTSAQTQAYLRAVDAAIAEQMRQLLHAPAFQAMEANWRGVQWLVSRLELEENLQLWLFDVTREELAEDLLVADRPLQDSASCAALSAAARRHSGEAGWSLLAGLYGFADTDDDTTLLTALGALGSQLGAAFIGSSARPDADAAPSPAWTALRQSPAARWLGLVSPRLLLRLPYGARSEKIERFAFEELADTGTHEHYLWAPGSLVLPLLLGRSYTLNEGWSFSPGDEREVDDLPSFTRPDRDGEPELLPCAEAFLTDAQAEKLLGRGLMPLLSHRHRNVALLMRVQSLAEPAVPLAGLPA